MLRPQENGIYNNIEEKHCSEIGKNLAIMHNAVSDFQETRHNDLGVFDFTKLFNKMLTEIDSYQDGLKDEIANYINFVQENWQAELPQGVVHVDLFPDNVFFNKNNEVSGIIDFYFAANDLFIYDLAITINAWAFDKNNNLDHTKYDSIIKSYQTIRKLNDAEKKFLKIALIAASLRFLLTRLYDKFNTPKDSLVKIKDPQEYLEKVRLFFQNQ
jgi:homoserine kinase type II